MEIFKKRTTPLDEDGQPLNAAFAVSRVTDRQIDESIGICKGIIADGSVNLQEAQLLLNWLDMNRESADRWPNTVLYPRIQAMLEDGVLDEEEEAELLDLLISITGSPGITASGGNASSTLPFDDPAPKVVFHGEFFCLSGKFASGPRREVEEAVTQRGGTVIKNPTKTTSFLVIGEVGSEDWIHSTHGRKIERAIELRDGGERMAIISEERLFDYLHG